MVIGDVGVGMGVCVRGRWVTLSERRMQIIDWLNNTSRTAEFGPSELRHHLLPELRQAPSPPVKGHSCEQIDHM